MSEPRKISPVSEALGKVSWATPMFWRVDVRATTIGESGGDTVSMTLKAGDLIAIMTTRIIARRYHPLSYWLVVVASTTVVAMVDLVSLSAKPRRPASVPAGASQGTGSRVVSREARAFRRGRLQALSSRLAPTPHPVFNDEITTGGTQ